MFIIPFFFKPLQQEETSKQIENILLYDNLQIEDIITNIQNVFTIRKQDQLLFTEGTLTNLQTVFTTEKIENLLYLIEEYRYIIPIQHELKFFDNLYLHLKLIITDYLFKLSYSQITSIELEDFLSARFLPDYHVIEYLAKEAQLDRYSVSKVLVALSNLLRDCKDYDVRQINAISLRIHKAIMNENKTVFVITEF
jgi:hypothetical protein